MANKIANQGVKALKNIATRLGKNEYLCYLEALPELQNLSLVQKTYLILWDWMEDPSNSLEVSAGKRLRRYVQLTLAEMAGSKCEEVNPARKTGNRLTSRELLHVAEEVADKVEHLAAVLGDSEVCRLRTMNERNLVVKTCHLLIGWEENQHINIRTRHLLACVLEEIGKTTTADK